MSVERLDREFARLKKLPLLTLMHQLEENGGGLASMAWHDVNGLPEAALVLIAGKETPLMLRELHTSYQVAELLKAAEAFCAALVARDAPCTAVGVNDDAWRHLNRSIKAMRDMMKEAT